MSPKPNEAGDKGQPPAAKISKIDQAAILLMTLGESGAAEILKLSLIHI